MVCYWKIKGNNRALTGILNVINKLPKKLFSANKTVLITGAAQRIGKAIALGFTQKEWNVIIHYHQSHEAAESLVKIISDQGGTALALKADLNQEEETFHLIPKITKIIQKPIDCLINNASIFERDDATTATAQSWQRHMQINLRAPFILSQSFQQQLPTETSGNIINIVDQRVICLTPYFTSYTLSKAGLWTLTQTLALAWAPYIRVNAIGPGPTLPSPRQSLKQFHDQCLSVPLQRGTDPEEISQAIQFIIGSSSITGQMLALDGGQHLGWAVPSKNYVLPE